MNNPKYSGLHIISKNSFIFPAAFLNAAGLFLINLGIVFYTHESFKAHAGTIGLLATLNQITYVLGCLFCNRIFDRIKPVYLTAAAALVMFVCSCMVFAVHSLAAIFFWFTLMGAGISFLWPPLMGWLTSGHKPAELSRLLSVYNMSWGAGLIISPFIAGMLASLSVKYPLYAAAVIFFLSLLLMSAAFLYFFRDKNGLYNVKTEGCLPENGRAGDFLRFPAWLGIFISYSIMGLINNSFPVYAVENIGLGKNQIGIIFFFRSTSNVLGFLLLGFTVRWHFKKRLMIFVFFFLAAAVFLVGRAINPVMLSLLMVFIGLTASYAYSSSAFHCTVYSPRRGMRMAMHEAVISMGLIAGALGGGYVTRYFSFPAACSAVSLLSLSAMSVCAVLLLHYRRKNAVFKPAVQ